MRKQGFNTWVMYQLFVLKWNWLGALYWFVGSWYKGKEASQGKRAEFSWIPYIPHLFKKRGGNPLATNRARKLDNWLKKTLNVVEAVKKNKKINTDLPNKNSGWSFIRYLCNVTNSAWRRMIDHLSSGYSPISVNF